MDTDWCDTQGFLLPVLLLHLVMCQIYLKPNLSNPLYNPSLNHLKTLLTRVLPSASHTQPVCEHSLNWSLMGWQIEAVHVCSGNDALWSMKMEGLSLPSRTAPPSVTDHSCTGSQQHRGRRDNAFYALIFNESSTDLCKMLHSNLLESDLDIFMVIKLWSCHQSFHILVWTEKLVNLLHPETHKEGGGRELLCSSAASLEATRSFFPQYLRHIKLQRKKIITPNAQALKISGACKYILHRLLLLSSPLYLSPLGAQ